MATNFVVKKCCESSNAMLCFQHLSGRGLCVLDSSGEDCVADGDGGVEDVDGGHPGAGHDHGLVPCHSQQLNTAPRGGFLGYLIQ